MINFNGFDSAGNSTATENHNQSTNVDETLRNNVNDARNENTDVPTGSNTNNQLVDDTNRLQASIEHGILLSSFFVVFHLSN